MRLPFPLTWLALVAMWLVLNSTLALADVLIGMLVALGGVLALRLLQEPAKRARRPMVALG